MKQLNIYSATKIQAGFRGMSNRKKVEEMKEKNK